MKDSLRNEPEVVIIRRASMDDTTAVKGGAWKIAYADFVTAMMAFFLVMWLINSANDATKAQVASYFNPIKLSDVRTNEKGLHDPSSLKQHGSTATPLSSATKPLDASSQAAGESIPETVGDLSSAENMALTKGPTHEQDDSSKRGQAEDTIPNDVHDPFERAAASLSQDPLNDSVLAENASDAPERPSPAERAKQSADRIAEDLKGELGQVGGRVEVRAVEDLVLISLADGESFSMFPSGSADPLPAAKSLLALIGKILEQNPGEIVIRGHTDSIPFKDGINDNWQLSTARAHAAQAMLLEGGVVSSRLRRIEGVADRNPRNKDKPDAPENRRIDILLKPQ